MRFVLKDIFKFSDILRMVMGSSILHQTMTFDITQIAYTLQPRSVHSVVFSRYYYGMLASLQQIQRKVFFFIISSVHFYAWADLRSGQCPKLARPSTVGYSSLLFPSGEYDKCTVTYTSIAAYSHNLLMCHVRLTFTSTNITSERSSHAPDQNIVQLICRHLFNKHSECIQKKKKHSY